MSDPSFQNLCVAHAVEEAPRLLGRCFDIAIAALQGTPGRSREWVVSERASKPWWDLLQNRSAWTQTYAQRLSEVFEAGESLNGAPVLQVALPDNGEPMDDSRVEETQLPTRLLQQMLPQLEQALAVLDARMGATGEGDASHGGQNPLRPSVFVRVLWELLVAVEARSETRVLWLKHLVPPMGPELGRLYQQLALLVQGMAAQQAPYRVRLVDDPQSYRPPPPPSRDLLALELASLVDAPVAKPLFPDLPDMRSLARVHSGVSPEALQHFLRQGGAVFEQGLAPEFHAEVQSHLERNGEPMDLPLLQEVVEAPPRPDLDVPAVDRTPRQVHMGSALDAQVWGAYASAQERTRLLLHSKAQAQRLAQVLGIEVVRKLLNQVARDPLLLAPVREAMVALEPALLRMALNQPRFFNEALHPARQLVETVAQRAFRYNDEYAAEFPLFLRPVQQVFLSLNAAKEADSKHFEDGLHALRTVWGIQDQRDETLRAQRVNALRFAQQRQELADQVAEDMRQRDDVAQAPDVVRAFLCGPWSLVLALARMQAAEGDADPGGYRAVVTDLLWSVRKTVMVGQPTEVFNRLPDLIQTLHRGLDLLGEPPQRREPFFEALMLLHRPVLRLRARARHEAAHSSPVPLEPAAPGVSAAVPPDVPVPPQAGGESKVRVVPEPVVAAAPPALVPWLDDEDLEVSGFMEEPASDFAGLPAVALAGEAVPEAEAAIAPESAETTMQNLRPGDWVDLHSEGEWLRAQLVWISDNGALLMFTSSGARTHTMSKRSCIKLLTRRWLRPVDAHSVVQTAILSFGGDTAAPAAKG